MPDKSRKAARELETQSAKDRQYQKFVEKARELETDESDAAFDAVVNKIAHAPKLTDEQIKELVRRKREQEKR
ncbi:hypothetical protein C7I87_19510 [Mesorhizobium sp. SARCC-RB16n]|uniref:hypothetical protein n=1 Tax=Mesorhizobium sp. SARCC-RB16n TaxID=2116687 RepID=UPI00122EFCE5|nr:hypothetical protein [Mesorhizobium sp. SARCC-RB16n]KAA3448860.1 hypothetical protein C7I87_19510 [Mesorhizobium sp. SARCC-RB16n]